MTDEHLIRAKFEKMFWVSWYVEVSKRGAKKNWNASIVEEFVKYKSLMGKVILITVFALHRIGKQKPLQSGLLLLVGDKEGIFDRRQSPKRGTILCSRFHLCGKEAESVNHLFLNRNVTAQLWQIYLNIKGLKWVMPRTLIQLLQCWNRGKRKKKKSFWRITIPANIWGTVRKERNTKCFEGKSKFDPTEQV